MEAAHQGKRSMVFPQPPVLLSYASVAGKKEAQGPLGDTFDVTSMDTKFGQKTWEKAETQMQKTAQQTSQSGAYLADAQNEDAQNEPLKLLKLSRAANHHRFTARALKPTAGTERYRPKCHAR